MHDLEKKQQFTSANTSINSTRLPAIYNRLDLSVFQGGRCLDWGAGKYTQHIKEHLAQFDIEYYPYDPFNCTEEVNKLAMSIWPTFIICSNVLNVIKEDEIVRDIFRKIHWHGISGRGLVPFFITVWEGDKSGIGKQSKDGCWQRNMRTEWYLGSLINFADAVQYHKTLCPPFYANKHYFK